MNPNIFSNAVLMPQDPSPNEFSDYDSFTSGEPFGSLQGINELRSQTGFQSDGPLASGLVPQDSMGGAGAPTIPLGLAAAIASAISRYFSQGSGSGAPTPFQNVSVASTGDPHESISGTQADGTGVRRNWKSMESHPNLLSAPDLAGGFRLSSQVSAPNAQGATMNSSVTASADHGRTEISFSADGEASVRQGEQVSQLAPNETMNLGGGLSVTDTGNAVRITAQNLDWGAMDRGASKSLLTTTLSKNGSGGVDVNAQGNNIVLGGYLVNSSSQ